MDLLSVAAPAIDMLNVLTRLEIAVESYLRSPGGMELHPELQHVVTATKTHATILVKTMQQSSSNISADFLQRFDMYWGNLQPEILAWLARVDEMYEYEGTPGGGAQMVIRSSGYQIDRIISHLKDFRQYISLAMTVQ